MAKCLALCIVGRIVDDEWETLQEAQRNGNFPEVVKAYVAGEDTECFNMRFPELINSGILEDVVDTYIQRILRRSIEPPLPLDKSEFEKRLKSDPALRQYMAMKGTPRTPRPTICKVVAESGAKEDGNISQATTT
jgi:hypothetical protein